MTRKRKKMAESIFGIHYINVTRSVVDVKDVKRDVSNSFEPSFWIGDEDVGDHEGENLINTTKLVFRI
jgi:hypothetical protein